MVTFFSSSTVTDVKSEVAAVPVLDKAETFEDLEDSSEVLWCSKVGMRVERRGGSSGLVRRGDLV